MNNNEKLSAKLKKANLTEEEVTLCFYREMKPRIVQFLPVIGGLIADAMIDTNAETMDFDCDLKKLNHKIEMNFKITEL